MGESIQQTAGAQASSKDIIDSVQAASRTVRELLSLVRLAKHERLTGELIEKFDLKIVGLVSNMDALSRACLQNDLFVEMARIKKIAQGVLMENAKLQSENSRMKDELYRLEKVRVLSSSLKELIDSVQGGNA